MLKKKNALNLLFVAMFSMLFCYAGFLGFVARKTAFVNAIELEGAEGGTSSYVNGTLSINNITYENSITLDEDTVIVFEGTNILKVSGEPTIYLFGHALSISGNGNSSLTIGNGTDLIFDAELVDVNYAIDIGNLNCQGWLDGEDEPTTFEGSIPHESIISLTKLEFTSVANEHTHDFAFEANAAVISASCNTSGCELDASKMTAILEVNNVTEGQTPTPSLSFGESWSATNTTLTLNETTLKYYPTESENSTEPSGEALTQAPTVVGNYVAVATFNLGGSDVSIKKAFKITALSVSVTPKDNLNFEYGELNNGTINPSSLFNFVNCEGLTDKYYIVTGSGESEVPKDSCYVSMGTNTIKVVVSNGDIPVAECIAVVIVEKTTPVFTVTFSTWEYGDENPPHHADGNVNSSLLIYTYYYDPGHTQPVGGVPTEIGPYYVTIDFPGTATMKAGSTTSTCTIVKKEVTVTWPNVTIVYNGNVQTINATFNGANNQAIPLLVTFDAEFKNVNTYTATASLTEEQKNYYELIEEVTHQYSIIPLELVIKIDDVSSYYQSPVKNLTAKYQGENVAPNDEVPYTLHCEVIEGCEMGAYQITGRLADPSNSNYSISFIKGTYYVTNRILSLSIESWVYGQPNEPSVTAYYGQEKIVYKYYNLSTGESTTTKPVEPGRYRLEANIPDDEVYYRASYQGGVNFQISKIKVSEPKIDQTNYVYDGSVKTYNVATQPSYRIEGNSQTQAGTYKVKIVLIDPAHYAWQSSSLSTLEYVFVINKKKIDCPAKDNRVFKYTGSNLEYFVTSSANYLVEGNIQSDAGVHVVRISLTDAHNTCWDTGVSSALEYEFVINHADITNPKTVNSKGETISETPVIIVDSGENGIHPDAVLNVVEINQNDKTQLGNVAKSLKGSINQYDSVFKVYDVSLKNGSEVIQPDGTITLKIVVPEELLNTNFKVYHIHTDEKGKKTVEKVECAGASELGFVTIQVDKLSEFVFVYEKHSLMPLIITFVCLLFAFAGVFGYLMYWYLKQTGKIKPKANKATLAGMPAMFIGSQIAWSVILGILLAGVIAGNIVLIVLILKNRKAKLEQEKQASEDTPNQAIDMSKSKKETKNKTSKEVKTNKAKQKTSKTQKKATKTQASKEPRSLDLTKKK